MKRETSNNEIMEFLVTQFDKVATKKEVAEQFDKVATKKEVAEQFDKVATKEDMVHKFEGVNLRIDDLANKVFVRDDVLERIELLEREMHKLIRKVAKTK